MSPAPSSKVRKRSVSGVLPYTRKRPRAERTQPTYDGGHRTQHPKMIRGHDKRVLAQVTWLTLIFLPGTLVSSVFSMGLFDDTDSDWGPVHRWYIISVIPTTTICLVIARGFIGRRPGRDLHNDSVPPLATDRNAETYGWTQGHVIFGPTGDDNLLAVSILGAGSSGVVEEVRCRAGQYPSFVRKKIVLPASKTRAAICRKIVQEEARILSSLAHPHIVSLIGSYEVMQRSRRHLYCLLMAPVCTNNLADLLISLDEYSLTSDFSVRWRTRIRDWMICLATALEYMHACGTRHQDIKPSNIVLTEERIYFTDFDSAATFEVGDTTSTDSPARWTATYSAPETLSIGGTHGTATDVFALGCTFCDMLNAAEGRKNCDFRTYLHNNGQPSILETSETFTNVRYSEKMPHIRQWFTGSPLFAACIAPMLHVDRKLRLSATEVVQGLLSIGSDSQKCNCVRDRDLSNAVASAEFMTA